MLTPQIALGIGLNDQVAPEGAEEPVLEGGPVGSRHRASGVGAYRGATNESTCSRMISSISGTNGAGRTWKNIEA